MSSVQPIDFPRFLELPFEIRWTIYEFCLPTRVIDVDVHHLRTALRVSLIREEQTALRVSLTREERLAFRHIVARFGRTPVIARASPEVYRELRRHMVAPPDREWVWSWRKYDDKAFTDPRPVIFRLRSDVLYISPDVWLLSHDAEEYLECSPFCLAKNQDAALAIDQEGIAAFAISKMFADQCLLGRKKCTIVLNETILIKSAEWIASCGLFGLFGEERTVLVDVDDFDRIDYFDRKLNGQGMIDGESPRGENLVAPGGIRRYSSYSNVDLQTIWHGGSPLVSAEERAEVIAKDKKEITRRIRRNWLLANNCYVLTNTITLSFGIGVGTSSKIEVDEEDPNSKLCLDKLPAFNFAVRIHVQDLEERARLSSAEEARRRL